MDRLSTDDPQWKQKASELAGKHSPFDVNDINRKEDTTFIAHLANKHSYVLTIIPHSHDESLGRAELRPGRLD